MISTEYSDKSKPGTSQVPGFIIKCKIRGWLKPADSQHNIEEEEKMKIESFDIIVPFNYEIKKYLIIKFL